MTGQWEAPIVLVRMMYTYHGRFLGIPFFCEKADMLTWRVGMEKIPDSVS